MPFFDPTVTTESDALFSYLEHLCNQLRLTARGLTDEQARSTPTTSSLSISGLIAHAAQGTFAWIQQVRDPTLEVKVEDFAEYGKQLGLEGLHDGAILPNCAIAEVVAAFETSMSEIEKARQSVDDSGLDLGTVVPMPDNPWMPQDFVMNVRWILCHLISEIARHAGHADIIRETIDGANSYQLNAEADGGLRPAERSG